MVKFFDVLSTQTATCECLGLQRTFCEIKPTTKPGHCANSADVVGFKIVKRIDYVERHKNAVKEVMEGEKVQVSITRKVFAQPDSVVSQSTALASGALCTVSWRDIYVYRGKNDFSVRSFTSVTPI